MPVIGKEDIGTVSAHELARAIEWITLTIATTAMNPNQLEPKTLRLVAVRQHDTARRCLTSA